MPAKGISELCSPACSQDTHIFGESLKLENCIIITTLKTKHRVYAAIEGVQIQATILLICFKVNLKASTESSAVNKPICGNFGLKVIVTHFPPWLEDFLIHTDKHIP